MKNKFIKQFAEENLKQATYNGTQFGDNIEAGDQVLVMKVSGFYVDKKYIDQVNFTNKGTDYAYTTRLKEDKYLILKSWEKNHQRYIDWTPFMYVVDASELIFESPWSDEEMLRFARVSAMGSYGDYKGCRTIEEKLMKFKQLNEVGRIKNK
jgi:hypothetical protein